MCVTNFIDYYILKGLNIKINWRENSYKKLGYCEAKKCIID